MEMRGEVPVDVWLTLRVSVVAGISSERNLP